MTGLLQDTLREQAEQFYQPVDLDQIMIDGRRRLARRHAAVAAASTAGCLALTAMFWTALSNPLSGHSDRTDQIAVDPGGVEWFAGSPLAYVVDGTLHVGEHAADLGVEVTAMAQTDAGIAYSDSDGAVWAFTGAEPTRVGRVNANDPAIRAGDTLVAWVEPGSASQAPTFVAHDLATGESYRDRLGAEVEGPDEPHPVKVYALDGQTVVLLDARGVVKWHPLEGTDEVLGAPPVNGTISDAEAGLLAFDAPDQASQDGGTRVSPTLSGGILLPQAWFSGALSPDGRHLVGESDPDVAAVFDTTTGEHVRVTSASHSFIAGYAWADNDTFYALGLGESAQAPSDTRLLPIDLLACEVGAACEVLADRVSTYKAEDGGADVDLTLPIGEPLG